jgi:hypothetical protein
VDHDDPRATEGGVVDEGLAEQIAAAVLRLVRGAVVCRVQAYTPTTQTADVLPLVSDSLVVDGARVSVPPQVVTGVPVVWLMGGAGAFVSGLAPGDLVLAFARGASHDEIDSGAPGPVLPGSTRRHDLSDLVVVAGYAPPGGLDPSRYSVDGRPVVWASAGGPVRLGSSAAAIPVVRADLLAVELTAIAASITSLIAVAGGGTPYVPGAPGSSRVVVDG